jgi:hypothetical protein
MRHGWIARIWRATSAKVTAARPPGSSTLLAQSFARLALAPPLVIFDALLIGEAALLPRILVSSTRALFIQKHTFTRWCFCGWCLSPCNTRSKCTGRSRRSRSKCRGNGDVHDRAVDCLGTLSAASCYDFNRKIPAIHHHEVYVVSRKVSNII